MNAHTHARTALVHRRQLLLAAAIAAVLAVAGCGGSPDPDPIPEGTDAHVQIDPLDPSGLDAPGAATTAMNAILSWQPAVDYSKAGALARARPWITTPLIDTLNAPQSTTELRPDKEWDAWARSKDSLTATCWPTEGATAPPAGMRTVIVDLECRQRVLHADGSSTQRPTEPWRATVITTPNGWKLSDFRYRTN